LNGETKNILFKKKQMFCLYLIIKLFFLILLKKSKCNFVLKVLVGGQRRKGVILKCFEEKKNKQLINQSIGSINQLINQSIDQSIN